MIFDVEQLRTFLAVHQAGGFANASKMLHRSQPAISRRIATLEEALGVPLFDRSTGGGNLTEAGQTLLRPAQKAIAALEDCRASVMEIQNGRSGPIMLAVVGTIADAGLAGVLKGFDQDFPGAELRLRTALSREVSDLVRSGEVTFGLRYHRDGADDLDCTQIAAERLVVACSPDDCRTARKDLRLLELKNDRWLTFPNRSGQEESANNIHAHFLARGLPLSDWTAIDSLTAQKRLVEA